MNSIPRNEGGPPDIVIATTPGGLEPDHSTRLTGNELYDLIHRVPFRRRDDRGRQAPACCGDASWLQGQHR